MSWGDWLGLVAGAILTAMLVAFLVVAVLDSKRDR
jgi:hypothetical protein